MRGDMTRAVAPPVLPAAQEPVHATRDQIRQVVREVASTATFALRKRPFLARLRNSDPPRCLL